MSTAPQASTELTPEASALARRQQEEWIDSISVVEKMTPEQITLIKNTVAKEATKDELRMFIGVCAMTRLNPLIKQIHFVKRWDSRANDGKGGYVGAFQVGIDGFRVIAERSKTYAGKVREEWCGPDGKWVDLWTRADFPFAARVTVRRHDWPDPVTFIARWSAYVQTKKGGEVNSMWSTRGPEQLAKCAEAGALRIVAPNDLSGLELLDESADRVEPEDRPLSITNYTNTDKADAEKAKQAVDAAIGGSAPASGAEVVVEGEADGATTDSSAPTPPAVDVAAPSAEPDYDAETANILESIYGAGTFTKRGGTTKLAAARKELVTWATRRGLAPDVAAIDAKAIWGFAVAYQTFKKAGEAPTEAATEGKEPPPASTVASGEDEKPAGAQSEPGAVQFDVQNFLKRCLEANKVFGGKRTFVMEHEGVWWFVDKTFLGVLGCGEALPINDDAEVHPLLESALRMVVAAAAEHQRNHKPAARGPAPL